MNRRSLFHDATPDPETQSDVRKDLAVHASLSSNQIVKEPALPSRDRKAAQPIDLLSRPQQARPAMPADPIACREPPNRRGEQAQTPPPVEGVIYSP
jgi:hypothetical protein